MVRNQPISVFTKNSSSNPNTAQMVRQSTACAQPAKRVQSVTPLWIWTSCKQVNLLVSREKTQIWTATVATVSLNGLFILKLSSFSGLGGPSSEIWVSTTLERVLQQ